MWTNTYYDVLLWTNQVIVFDNNVQYYISYSYLEEYDGHKRYKYDDIGYTYGNIGRVSKKCLTLPQAEFV